MANTWSFQFMMTLATLILIVGVVEDLRLRKVRNVVVLGCAGVAVVSTLIIGILTHSLGMSVLASFTGFGGAIAVCLPFVLMGILGAGDMKLLAAFGLATSWNAVLTVFIASLVWGAVLGVISAITHGQGKSLLRNTAGVIVPAWRVERSQLHAMPYTVALMFGWVTHLVLLSTAGGVI